MVMKKILFVTAAAALLAAGCQNAEPVDSNISGSEVFRISAPIQQTKTVFNGADYTVAWESSDQMTITVNSTGNYTFVKSAEGGDIFETAEAISVSDGDKIFALYPANNDLTAITIPSAESATQTGINSTDHIKGVIYGTGTVSGTGIPSIQMHQLTALLKIDVKNSSSATINVTGIKVAVNADNQNLSGSFSIDQTTGAVKASDAVASTSLNAENGTIAAGETGTFWVSANPFTLPQGSELEIMVKTDKGSMTDTRTYEKDLNFAAGTVNKASFDFNAVQYSFAGGYEALGFSLNRGETPVSSDGQLTFGGNARLLKYNNPKGEYTFHVKVDENSQSDITFSFGAWSGTNNPVVELWLNLNGTDGKTNIGVRNYQGIDFGVLEQADFTVGEWHEVTFRMSELAAGGMRVEWILDGTIIDSIEVLASQLGGAEWKTGGALYLGAASGTSVSYDWYQYTPIE